MKLREIARHPDVSYAGQQLRNLSGHSVGDMVTIYDAAEVQELLSSRPDPGRAQDGLGSDGSVEFRPIPDSGEKADEPARREEVSGRHSA
jgi:hypothetical protein